ncbi:hypothetical protein SB49_02780 [Sediminicola sp. YIK13]|uniref:DUF1801 domain-containing protein n=1 Tax=Sediminicola sp. YIK13 TaxID=1453352 RepID=UPI00071F21E3|nr:DUF1801 domain-containing protein [Sediminicola sp. YIK13]ALM06846.1 hypothetical protein SB49_02780 [Sediminicola sp. YIK13]
MSENKTIPTNASVTEFLNTVDNETRRKDCFVILEKMKEITGKPAVMWGNSIVGFGSYHYKYDSGREGDMLITGFSPRKQNLTLYILDGFDGHQELLKKLGPHKTGKSCLYIKKLSDIDMDILSELISTSFAHFDKKYNT